MNLSSLTSTFLTDYLLRVLSILVVILIDSSLLKESFWHLTWNEHIPLVPRPDRQLTTSDCPISMKFLRIIFACDCCESLRIMGNSAFATFSTLFEVSYIDTPTLYWHLRSITPWPLISSQMFTDGGTLAKLPVKLKLKLNTCLPAAIVANWASTSLSRKNLCSLAYRLCYWADT